MSFKYLKELIKFLSECGSEDKLYCCTYCYNSCNTFSRLESGDETKSQTSQFHLDILNQNQEQVSTDTLDLYRLQHVVEFVIQAGFFLDERVLLLPVVYEKYKSLFIY